MTKFNIVIPTRERADTLYWSLKSCVSQKYENLTIWVSDNCSLDNTEEVVKSFSDKRIRYLKTPERVSMSANWEFALGFIEEGFVTYIGDDDAMLPDAFEFAAKLLKENKVDALSFGSATYYWPDVGAKSLQGQLTIPRGNSYSVRNSREDLRKTTQDIFSSIELPGLYWGAVDIRVLKHIQSRHAGFFHSLAPDFYSAVIIASYIESHLYCERPIILRGFSRHSNGVSYVNSEFDQAPAQLFMKEKNMPVNEQLVFAPSLSIILADCILQASKVNPEIPKLNIYTVVEKAAHDAVCASSKYKFDEIVEAIKAIGEKNGIRSYCNRMLKGLTYPEKSGGQTAEINTDNSVFNIKTIELAELLGLKISNVFEASLFASQFLMPFAVNKADNVLSARELVNNKVDGWIRNVKSKVIKLTH